LCGQTGDGGPPIRLRGATHGTVSASLIALPCPPGRGTYLHAQGPPDQTPFADCSDLLGKLFDPADGV
jgi:hypothetical protein